MVAVVIADDLTGALESGALLAEQGVGCTVTLDWKTAVERLRYPAIVIDSESRHLGPEEARARMREIARQCRGRGVRFVYKKTDSTLRGNIGAELQGLMDEIAEPVVFVPAYPRVGRTVSHGVLFVDGVPLAETAFARDPRNPMRESSVVRVLERDLRVHLNVESGGEPGVFVFDAETEEEMAGLAARLEGRRLVASPAGFLAYWARTLPVARAARPEMPRIRTCLVVCGSLHPRSREQAAEAERVNLPGWRVIRTGDVREGAGESAAREIAAEAAGMASGFDGLAVFGGDTAISVLRELGVTEAEPCGEVLPGVPVSRIAVGRVMITKAGGFGPVDLVARIHRALAEPLR